MPAFEILTIPCLSDNYAYAIVDLDRNSWIVDPSEPDPVREVLEEHGLRLRGILATHHHPDHVGGVPGLLEYVQAKGHDRPWVAAHVHDRDRIHGQSVFVDAPVDTFVTTDLRVAGALVDARWIPGHTLGAIAWRISDGDHSHVFTGDTLFAAGCGRLFEGSPQQMHTSLQGLAELPPGTRLWFGHEYTAANLQFAHHAEPDNPDIRGRQSALSGCTTPTTVALELATNPFVRATTGDHLGELRRAKDSFRG